MLYQRLKRTRLKIQGNLRKTNGWHLKPRHVVVDEGNFLFVVFLGRKLMFENI